MNRTILLFIVLTGTFVSALASPGDSVKTYYKDGYFSTYCKVWVNAPRNVVNEVIDDFVEQSKFDLDQLFEWGLKDMKLRTEEDKLIVFNFKSATYDAKNDLIKCVGDVKIPGIISFPDIHVDSRMTKSYLKNGNTCVRIDVMYSDAFLRETSGLFYAIPEKEKGYWITLETKVKFGWFFNVFITQPMFRSIMEWRFHQMMINIRNEAENRTKAIKTRQNTGKTPAIKH